MNQKNSRYGRRYKNQLNTCLECSTQFHPRLGIRNQKYCDKACFEKGRIATKVEKICPQCTKPFSVYEKMADRYTVCSIECRLAVREYVKCKRCDKSFLSKKPRRSVYCSEACYRPPVTSQCLTCNKEFRHVPAQDRRFCTSVCFRKFEGETRIEIELRQSLDRLGISYGQEFRIGRYRADFAITEGKIDIEADGPYWHDPVKDARRDSTLARYGWTTIRFTQEEILDVDNLDSLVRSRLQPLLS